MGCMVNIIGVDDKVVSLDLDECEDCQRSGSLGQMSHMHSSTRCRDAMVVRYRQQPRLFVQNYCLESAHNIVNVLINCHSCTPRT